MSNPKVIGLYSSVPQSGKSTVANHLRSMYQYYPIPFAATLKDMADVFLTDLGVLEPYEYLYDKKHVNLSTVIDIDEELRPRLDFTVRHMLQTLGTEWGRNCIAEDIWLTVWEAKANRMLRSGINVIVDDVRFPNEFEKIQSIGGEVWKIVRPSLVVDESVVKHASEGSLDDYDFTATLYNTGTVECLRNTADMVLSASSVLASI
jgi:hypothetical protein